MKKRTTRASGTESTATNSDGAERAAAHRLVKVAPGVGPNRTVGVDLGDRTSHFCVLDEGGMVVNLFSSSPSRATVISRISIGACGTM